MARILLIGESEIRLYEIRHNGFDTTHMTSRHSEAHLLIAALTAKGHSVQWVPADEAAESLPLEAEGFRAYDVIIVSDVGSNTLLMPRAVHQGIPQPNRLALLRDWTAEGGGLMMCGGWMSFAGMNGTAHYHRTAIENALPVQILPYDDRMERPEGIVPNVLMPEHAVVQGLGSTWPRVLGYNLLQADGDASVLVETPEHDPLLVVAAYGRGRSAAWASDVAPHWLSQEFADWEGYSILFGNIVAWLAGGPAVPTDSVGRATSGAPEA